MRCMCKLLTATPAIMTHSSTQASRKIGAKTRVKNWNDRNTRKLTEEENFSLFGLAMSLCDDSSSSLPGCSMCRRLCSFHTASSNLSRWLLAQEMEALTHTISQEHYNDFRLPSLCAVRKKRKECKEEKSSATKEERRNDDDNIDVAARRSFSLSPKLSNKRRSENTAARHRVGGETESPGMRQKEKFLGQKAAAAADFWGKSKKEKRREKLSFSVLELRIRLVGKGGAASRIHPTLYAELICTGAVTGIACEKRERKRRCERGLSISTSFNHPKQHTKNKRRASLYTILFLVQKYIFAWWNIISHAVVKKLIKAGKSVIIIFNF